MVCAALIYHAHHPELYGKILRGASDIGEWKKRQSQMNLTSIGSDRPTSAQDQVNGDYQVIRKLIHIFDNGQQIKNEVDEIIDGAEHMQNMRTAICDCKNASLTNSGEEGRDASFWLRRGTNYLQRYWSLIAFNAYLHQQENPFAMSYTEWRRERWQLTRMLNMISLD
eukprot:Sdes_comp18701_c0_seq1m9001